MPRRFVLKVLSTVAATSAVSAAIGERSAHAATPTGPNGGPRRIAIVGGGCAGVTLARFLEDQGQTNITLFERSDTVGGKCKTLTFAGFPEIYEMGAIELNGGYGVIGALADEYGLVAEAMPSNYLVDLNHPNPPTLPPQAAMFELIGAAGYAQFQTEYAFWLEFLATYPQIQNPGFANLPAEICVDFEDWRVANGIEYLQLFFLPLITLYGYGYLLGDDKSGNIPLPYMMKYLNEEKLSATFAAAGLIAPPAGVTTTGLYRWSSIGFGGLMKAVAGALKHTNVRTSSPVVSVNRRKNCADGPGRVTIGFINSNGWPSEEVFDDVVIAIPQTLANLQAIGLDLTPAELALFSNVKTRQYFTFAVKANQFQAATAGYDFVINYGTTPPSITFHPTEGTPFQLFVPMTKATATGEAVSICYSYTDVPMSLNQIRQNVVAGINSLGGTPIDTCDILDANAWQYFPHVDAPALASGFYDQVEALQGGNRTYWAGGLMNFELTERTAAYSLELAATHFTV